MKSTVNIYLAVLGRRRTNKGHKTFEEESRE